MSATQPESDTLNASSSPSVDDADTRPSRLQTGNQDPILVEGQLDEEPPPPPVGGERLSGTQSDE